MKTINSLPPEIMHLILSPGHFFYSRITLHSPPDPLSKDYIKLRLVCQTFSAIISPHIFRHLRIKSIECSLRRLESIAESQNLKGLIKKYSYTFYMSRLSPNRTAHDEYLRLAADPSGFEDPAIIHSSKDPAMINIAHWLDQRAFELSNDLHELHVKHLSTLPNLTSISIEAPAWCGLSDVPHDMVLLTGAGRPWGPLVFRAVLLALYNRAQLKNITPLEALHVGGITEECMLLPPTLVAKAIAGIRGIKHLSLSIRAIRGTDESNTPGWILLIGRLIQSVASLESLRIEVQDSQTNLHFRSLVTPCKSNLATKSGTPLPALRWPNLQKLILCDMIFSESHLLKFIAMHKKSLNHLTLRSCHLRPDPGPTKENTTTQPDPSVPDNPWLPFFRTIHTHFPPHPPSALSHFCVDQLWLDERKQRQMHKCQTSNWKKYITGTNDVEPEVTLSYVETCQDCVDDAMIANEDSSEESSSEGYFFGPGGFGFGGYWDDEEEDDFDPDIDSDMDEDDLDDDYDPIGMGPPIFLGDF